MHPKRDRVLLDVDVKDFDQLSSLRSLAANIVWNMLIPQSTLFGALIRGSWANLPRSVHVFPLRYSSQLYLEDILHRLLRRVPVLLRPKHLEQQHHWTQEFRQDE